MTRTALAAILVFLLTATCERSTDLLPPAPGGSGGAGGGQPRGSGGSFDGPMCRRLGDGCRDPSECCPSTSDLSCDAIPKMPPEPPRWECCVMRGRVCRGNNDCCPGGAGLPPMCRNITGVNVCCQRAPANCVAPDPVDGRCCFEDCGLGFVYVGLCF